MGWSSSHSLAITVTLFLYFFILHIKVMFPWDMSLIACRSLPRVRCVIQLPGSLWRLRALRLGAPGPGRTEGGTYDAISKPRSRFFACQCGEPLSGAKQGTENVCRAVLCPSNPSPRGRGFLHSRWMQLCLFTDISAISVCASFRLGTYTFCHFNCVCVW